MPDMPCACFDFLGSVQAVDNGDGTNLLGTTSEEGELTRVRGRVCGGVASDALSESARHGAGGLGRIPPPPGEAQNYRVFFPKRLLRIRCPVEGFLGGASNRANLRVHFAHRHAQDTIVILEEGNRPYPRCPQFDMFVSHKDLNGLYLTTALCRRGAERKRRRLTE